MLANAQGSDYFFIAFNMKQTVSSYFICFFISSLPTNLQD